MERMNLELYAVSYDELMRRCDTYAGGNRLAWAALLRETFSRVLPCPLAQAGEGLRL